MNSEKYKCIICESNSNQESIEHIVPRSLGNIYYILHKGVVCRNCNNRFSRFESRVIASDIFCIETKRFNRHLSDQCLSSLPLDRTDALRFTMKIGYEALFKSKRHIWENLPHAIIRKNLLRGDLLDKYKEQVNQIEFTFRPIPGWWDKWGLKLNHIEIQYGRNVKGEIMVRFKYGRISMLARIK